MRLFITALAFLMTFSVLGQEDEIYEEIVFTYSGVVNSWIVPPGVNLISITISGAQGGNNAHTPCTNYSGGLGATMTGDFSVTPGTEIMILVGEKGNDHFDPGSAEPSCNGGGGGGGGSFIWIEEAGEKTLLIAAGGGGGSSKCQCGNDTPQGVSGVISSSGTADALNFLPGGVNGADGGNIGVYCGEGLGWNSISENPELIFPSDPYEHYASSSFGGGGSSSGDHSGGGGGGYSGGGVKPFNGAYGPSSYIPGPGPPACGGGGGGSYNSGQNQNNISGVNAGNGVAIISYYICDIPVFAGADIALCNQPIPEQLTGFYPGLSEGGTGSFYGLINASQPGAVSAVGVVNPYLLSNGLHEVVYSFTSSSTNCTNSDTLLVSVTSPVTAYAGPDTTVCYNAPMLQLEGFFPNIGMLWSGTDPTSTGALIDSQAGLINPQLLPPGSYTYLLEFGAGTCYSTDLITVTVDALPVLTLDGDDVFCENDEVMPLSTLNPLGLAEACGEGLVTVNISVGGGAWDSEISWSLDADSVNAASGFAPSSTSVCLAAGDYTLTMNDAYADGWDGANATFTNGLGEVIGFYTLDGVNDDGATGTATLSVSAYGTWEGYGVVDPIIGTFDTGIGVGDWDLIYWYTSTVTTCSDTINHVVSIQEIPTGDCDCNGNQLDVIGVCGGDCSADADEDGLCDDVDDCVGSFDECGVCNGPGAIYECGCADIPEGECDCDGSVPEYGYDCDGNCIIDTDNDGVCDEFEINGCTELNACNFNDVATENDNSCYFIGDSCDDSDITTGNDVYNENCDCEGISIGGCMDIESCNYSEIATFNNNSCIFIGDPCDDLNPLTFDDYIDEYCFCGGIEITTVNELEALQVKIYPNPASNNLTIDLGDLSGMETSIKIFDSSSKLVFEKLSSATLLIDVSIFAKGLYTLELSTSDKVLRSQVVIE